MSSVTVCFYALLRLKFGQKRVELEAANVAEALEKLKGIVGDKVREVLFDGDEFKDSYIVLLHGHRIFREKFADVNLADGDLLHIFPPVGGG